MNAELEKAKQALMKAREEVVVITSPLRLDQVKRPKWQSNLETTSAQSSQPWPPPSLAPVALKSNLAKWEAFDWDRHPKLRPAKRVIVDWYNGLPDSGALVLAGDVGCGKTHLAGAIADLYGRWRISYYEEIELVKKIQATYGLDAKGNRKAQSEESIIRALFRADLFVLDDLGTYETNNTAWMSNIYSMIFNDYLTVKRKPMMITTNLSMFGPKPADKRDDRPQPGGMADRIGARSFSRLCAALGDLSQGRYIDLFGMADQRIKGFLGER